MTTDVATTIIFLFQNQTISANGTAQIVNFPNKTASVKAWGTFDGASFKLQSLAPQSSPATWIDVPNKSGSITILTAAGQFVIEDFVQNEQIRGVISGAGASTTITATLEIV